MSHSRLEEDAGVVVLTFTRDEKLNAVSAEMLGMLWTALDRLEDDASVRVLVIRAEGRHFTAGMDLGAVDLDSVGMSVDDANGMAFRAHYRKLHDLFDRIERIEKPVVVEVQGPCRGVGVEFGMSCDFRFCSERATFALPEVEHLGVIPGSGGVSRLTRIVGSHWAKWIAMAGQSVDAERALAIGLVHQVVPETDLRATVDAFSRHLASMSAEAVGLAKITIDAAVTVDRGTAREIERIANTVLISTGEHRRRIDAFNQRGREE
jgi:enoyl-CoA hydratase/carnithine racemase